MDPAPAARLRLIAIRIVDHPAGTEPVMVPRIVVTVPVTAACAQPQPTPQPTPQRQPRRRHRIAVTTTAILERIALIAPLIVAVVTTMGTELAVTIIALVSPIQDRPTQIATVTETPVNVTL